MSTGEQEPGRREAAVGATERTPYPTPRQLPAAQGTFLGRDSETATITSALRSADRPVPPVVVIHGPGGVGKSALAVRVAHTVREVYPDGQLYLDLHGASPGLSPLAPEEAVSRCLRAVGVAASSIPTATEEAAAKLRSVLADKRVLLLLDNAADAAQVRPLLPATEGCAALITSRSTFTTVDHTLHVALEVLPANESIALLSRLDFTGRLSSDPSRAAQISELCGHLPLALRIAAARITSRPDWPLATFADRLADQQQRLNQLGCDDLSVRSCFLASYQALLQGDASDAEAARAFRMLGLPDGPDISLTIAARLLDRSEVAAEAALDRLVDTHLLESPAPGRYRFHDLLRLYARELAHVELTEADRYTALDRAWRCYIAIASAADEMIRSPARPRLFEPESEPAITFVDSAHARMWLDDERVNLLSAAEQAARAPHQHSATAIQIAHSIFGFLLNSAHWTVLQHLSQLALDTARLRLDRQAEAQFLSDLGVTAWSSGQGDRAVQLLQDSVAIRRELGDRHGEAAGLKNLATAYTERGQYVEALECAERAVSLWRMTGDRYGEAVILLTMGQVKRRMGELDTAAELLSQYLTIFQKTDHRRAQASALDDLGSTALDRGDVVTAVDCYQRALTLNRDLQADAGVAWNLVGLGEAHRRSGEPRRAVEMCEEALTISRQIGTQQQEGLALWRLGLALADVGEPDRARDCWRQAFPILERLGTPEAAEIRSLLRRTLV
ncbi:MAG: tetratricopeptide repeat protein [Micromonosporaceae bacterium]